MEDEASFAQDLLLARDYAALLLGTYRSIRAYAANRMGLAESELPAQLDT